MEKINKIIIIIISYILCLLIGYIVGNNNYIKNNKVEVIPIDTTYNKVVLDSIEYNIIKRDSIIYKLKEKYYDELEKVISASDSDVVKQFKALSTGR